jgi:hypothetical protein
MHNQLWQLERANFFGTSFNAFSSDHFLNENSKFHYFTLCQLKIKFIEPKESTIEAKFVFL